jgi:signal transduction histidine kinase
MTSEATSRPARILLVDDDRADCLAISRFLGKRPQSYTLQIASSLEEARQRFRAEPFDVVILDYMLGDGTGLEMLAEIGEVPAVLLTGYADEENAARALQQGAYDYLVKDADSKYLLMLPVTIDNALEFKRLEQLASEQADEMQQFAYIVSHDLQEPVRTVVGFCQLLERRYKGRLDERADEYIQFVVDGGKRMQSLLQDVLQYSRVTTRPQPLETVESTMALNDALARLQLPIEGSGAQITYDALPTIQADHSQLLQLFKHLIDNAIKFHGPRPPRVHISAAGDGHEWRFSVRDNGIGISPQHFQHIFQIFRRLHARDEYPGTGIGLAIAKRIVERHGGRIWVESVVGAGSVFHFTIPRRDPPAQ